MKRSLILLVFTLAAVLGAVAQSKEDFDVATFTPPAGWKKEVTADSVKFSIANKDDYCLIILFRSIDGQPKPADNFEAAWRLIVKNAVPVDSEPQMAPDETRDGWQIVGGYAPFTKGDDKGIVLLYTATGFGKMVNASIITNTQAYEPQMTAFLTSIRLKAPTVAAPPVTSAAVNTNGSAPSLAGNFWKQAGIRGGMLGHSGLSTGSFSKTYQFLPNGTYKFSRVDMQLAAPKYYLESEEGTYSVSGTRITISAKRSSYSQHRLTKEEPPIKSGSLPLTTAQYNLDFWINDGNWAMLLSPVDGSETKRDGTFSFYRNGEAQRTYQYVLVNAKGELIR